MVPTANALVHHRMSGTKVKLWFSFSAKHPAPPIVCINVHIASVTPSAGLCSYRIDGGAFTARQVYNTRVSYDISVCLALLRNNAQGPQEPGHVQQAGSKLVFFCGTVILLGNNCKLYWQESCGKNLQLRFYSAIAVQPPGDPRAYGTWPREWCHNTKAVGQ